VKRTFDPDGIFNPGKVVDCPPMTRNLRYGAGYVTPRPETFFDYDEYGGMGGAVEMCSGLGVCRKTLDGTMCPSYMATKEESHSTRGRANVLRLAMAGRLNESGLGDEGVKEVMALCLECRACKAECPVGVDVARFKSEFLADYWKRHGTSLRARVLGHIHDLSHWGSRFAPLSNAIAQSAPVRWINEQLLGLDSRRKPPAWTSTTFSERFAKDPATSSSAEASAGPRTFLFNDTFTNFYNPDIGMAGANVLRAIGRQPMLAPNGCCGRPLISQGLLAEARVLAARNAAALYPLAERGDRFVFFEPSCLSAVKEDGPSLLRGEGQRRAKRVAEASVLFEDFVESAWPKSSCLKAGPTTIQLHGHCHQKAMGLLSPAKALLSRIPGASVVDLNAGCCGMAGSFGYVRDHYDVSRAIGERRLLPAARNLTAGSVLVASGVSCRHQVEDFTGVRALHPAELIESLITRSG
jgi:Fe-S oxidoreductase